MKKLTTLLLLAALLLQTAACGSGGSGEKTPSDASDSSSDTTTAEEILPNLPDANYGGYTFTFYGRGELKDQISEEESGDTMDDAVYKRNRAVSERFNVEFEVVQCGDAYAVDAINVLLAGDDAYDVILPHARFAFSYGMQGLALNWNTDLPWIDLDAGWWEQDARESFEIMGNLCAMTGDIDCGALGATKCFFFNRAIFDEYGWDYPYQTILDGNWTFDELGRLATESARDLNGDTVIDIDNDRLGFAATWWTTPINILNTAGVRVCEKDSDGALKLTLNSSRTVEVFENFFKLMDDEGCYLHLADDSTPVRNAFRDGRVTFMESLLSDAKNLRDMNDDFGIIPAPKYDDTMEDYATGVDAGCNLFVVPITASDPERTSAILEALAYESWKTVIPAYYDVSLSVKFARDEESVQMLDIIRSSKVYDVGYFNGEVPFSMSSAGWELSKTADHNFSSFYAANESAAITQIEKINEAFANH